MSLESRKILDMLAEGKITSSDAEKLLEKLATSADDSKQPESTSAPERTDHVRYLRIQVDEPGRKPVNIRMPLAFARAGMSLVGMLPVGLSDKLKERGIDLDKIRFHTGFGKDENMEALKQLDLDVDKGDGKKVRIFCE
jgi:SHOCT-like protein